MLNGLFLSIMLALISRLRCLLTGPIVLSIRKGTRLFPIFHWCRILMCQRALNWLIEVEDKAESSGVVEGPGGVSGWD